MKDINRTAIAPHDYLSTLISAYGGIGIICRLGVDNGLSRIDCESVEALLTILNECFNAAVNQLYTAVDKTT